MVRLFTFYLVVFALTSCSERKQSFRVDKAISGTIDSICKADMLTDGDLNPPYAFRIKRNFDYESFGRKGVDWAHFLPPGNNARAGWNINGMSECFLEKDTIDMTMVLNYEGNIGISLTVSRSSFTTKLVLRGDAKVYSRTGTGSDMVNDMMIDPENVSLVLANRPVFESGKAFKGKMDVKFKPFYQLNSANELSKISLEVSILIDTEVR